jgi:tetratricopeptide (TPR) repeat protein
MKYGKQTILGVGLLLFLIPTGKAFMSTVSLSEKALHEAPLPPMKGRSAEKGMNGYLTRPDTSLAVWLKKGKSYYARKEYEQAIWAFRKALRENPMAGEVHFLLGVTYEARGKEGLPGDMTSWDTLAERSYRSAIAAGDYLPARFNLGMLFTRLARHDEARREWEHILTISPKSSLGSHAKKALTRNFTRITLPEVLETTFPGEDD